MWLNFMVERRGRRGEWRRMIIKRQKAIVLKSEGFSFVNWRGHFVFNNATFEIMRAMSILILISFHNVYGLFSTRIGYGINNGPQTKHSLDDIGDDNNWQDQWGGMKVRLDGFYNITF